MAIMSTRMHGTIDYPFGALLIALPWIFGFADGGVAQWVAVVAGGLVLLQAMMTQYELGLLKVIPMRTHLIMDFLLGALLVVSPWLFGFDDQIWWPFVVLGAIAIVSALLTPGISTGPATANP